MRERRLFGGNSRTSRNRQGMVAAAGRDVGELFKAPLPESYRGVLRFLVIYMAMSTLITYVPAITPVPLSLLK
jgi:hypothetical protein